MDRAALAEGAIGGTVTPERLSELVLTQLRESEQPHHLLMGTSLDVERGGESERAYSAVDERATAVASDRRLVVVVPQSVGTRVETVSRARVESVEASASGPTELRVTTPDGYLQFNAVQSEDPTGMAEFLRGWATDGTAERASVTDGAGTHRSYRGDDGGATDASPVTRGGSTTAGGGRDTESVDWGVNEPDAGDPGGPPEGRPERAADGERSDRGGDDALATLERLAALHEEGVLDDEEFERKKRDLLEKL
jgi:hypothetical protein